MRINSNETKALKPAAFKKVDLTTSMYMGLEADSPSGQPSDWAWLGSSSRPSWKPLEACVLSTIMQDGPPGAVCQINPCTPTALLAGI